MPVPSLMQKVNLERLSTWFVILILQKEIKEITLEVKLCIFSASFRHIGLKSAQCRDQSGSTEFWEHASCANVKTLEGVESVILINEGCNMLFVYR